MQLEPSSARKTIHRITGDILESKRQELGLSYGSLESPTNYDRTYIFRLLKAQRELHAEAVTRLARAVGFDDDYSSLLCHMLSAPQSIENLSQPLLVEQDPSRISEVAQLFLTNWEALTIAAILASGLQSVAERYLSNYAPTHSLNRSLTFFLESMPLSHKVTALETMRRLIINNRRSSDTVAIAKMHLSLHYGGKYGDDRLRSYVHSVLSDYPEQTAVRSGYAGLGLSGYPDALESYLKWSSQSESAMEADTTIHVGYYGGVSHSVDHLVKHLASDAYRTLWPTSLNTLTLFLKGFPSESFRALEATLRDSQILASLRVRLAEQTATNSSPQFLQVYDRFRQVVFISRRSILALVET